MTALCMMVVSVGLAMASALEALVEAETAMMKAEAMQTSTAADVIAAVMLAL